ncbi:MAG: pseudouridine synthase [Phycisphaerae bacterium]
MGKLRIQKYLAEAGVASRRAAEEMVTEGRVEVNGKILVDLPIFVAPDADEVIVDGKPVRPSDAKAGRMYFLLNKPRGVVCTQSDPQGRPRAVDLIPSLPSRVYCVGRLDLDSTGLIVLTNDGDLTEYLTHPRHQVTKTYVVEIPSRVEGDAINVIKKGIYLDGKKTQRSAVKVLKRDRNRTLMEIRLTEGRNREIRRMLARVGYKVRRLHRKAIGPITDRGVKIGNYRPLRPAEVEALRSAGQDKPAKQRSAGPKGGPRKKKSSKPKKNPRQGGRHG